MGFCILLVVLLFHCAGADPTSVYTVHVGDSITLPVMVPQETHVTILILRSISRGEGIAILLDKKEFTILSLHYVDRVTFLKDKFAFRITNLSLDDGGNYEISANISSSENILSSFTIVVFNISKTVSSLHNNSCLISLYCEAGMGSDNEVTYSWKDTKTDVMLGQESLLTQMVHTNEKKDYTCTARSSINQSALNIVFKHPCIRNSASPGQWVLDLASLQVRGFLVSTMTAAVLLL